ncbi:hypothetical protein V2O64_11885 [Verrucomicrobiaceae bacterium 227]
MKRLSALFFSTALLLQAGDWSDYYTIESVAPPAEVDQQFGALTALKDGRLAAAFNSGEVQLYDPAKNSWSLFAQGLQIPLGLIEDQDGSLLVSQWSGLTRLRDTDKDGLADHYENVCNDFGITGNYHEFVYGPARDKEGNLYLALNVASNNGAIFPEVRGPFTEIGLDRELLTRLKEPEIKRKYGKEAGRMYSRVAYRGCILKITPDGKATPFAYGFRSPDGIGFDEAGRLWVTDNQGDWRGTSPLYHVTEGGFYGHPASLVWKEGWTRNPLEVPVKELNEMRTPAAGLFPHGELANSPTQPIPTIDPELFGLPRGEILIGDMNQPNLIRFLAEEVNGVTQGTMIPFLITGDLGIGNHRLTFTKDGSLWIGKTHIQWAGDEGMKRITFQKKPIFLVEGVSLTDDGFKVSFNHPVGEVVPKVTVSRHTYKYHADYGSPKVDVQDVEVSSAVLDSDRKSLHVVLPGIQERYLYTITVENAKDGQGAPLMGDVLRYHVVKKR